MQDFFWDIFKNSGDIDAFMTYKAFDEYNKSKNNKTTFSNKKENNI